MRLDEIRLIARERGITTRNRKKEELIRAILDENCADNNPSDYTIRTAGRLDPEYADRRRF